MKALNSKIDSVENTLKSELQRFEGVLSAKIDGLTAREVSRRRTARAACETVDAGIHLARSLGNGKGALSVRP